MVKAVSFARADWHIAPVRPPHVVRRCSGCDATSAFRSTGKFRINANKRCVEVWLIYRCTTCNTGWKRPVRQRGPVARICPDLLDRFHLNDPSTAEAHAFAPGGVQLEPGVPFTVARPALDGPCMAHITMTRAFRLRWDQLLAQTLAISRSRVQRLATSGRIRVPRRPRRVASGAIVILDLDPLCDLIGAS